MPGIRASLNNPGVANPEHDVGMARVRGQQAELAGITGTISVQVGDQVVRVVRLCSLGAGQAGPSVPAARLRDHHGACGRSQLCCGID